MPHHGQDKVRLFRLGPTLRRRLLAVLYLVAISGLIVWEYRERLVEFTAACELEDPSPRSTLYAESYRRMMAWATPEASSHVALVAIPEDLERIHSNLCLGRGYMADVLQAVAAQHPAEIVIDKFYSASACPANDPGTLSLAATIEALPLPVIVGESTGKAEQEADHACLVGKQQLEFHAPNVRHGLTRLSLEPERIPLVWRVLPAEEGEAAQAEAGAAHAQGEAAHPRSSLSDSLSWAAVKAYDPEFAQGRLARLAEAQGEPYARIHVRMPRTTTTALLCKVGDEATRERWQLECGRTPQVPNLVGKVVVIGAELESDRKVALGASTWGYELQALYIEDLLSGKYLQAVPVGIDFMLFAAFVLFIEGIPTALKALRPEWHEYPVLAWAYHHRNYAWIFLGAALFLVGTSVIALAIGFLPPMLVFGEILLVAVTRLLLFTAGTIEVPLVQHHPHSHEGSWEHGHDTPPIPQPARQGDNRDGH